MAEGAVVRETIATQGLGNLGNTCYFNTVVQCLNRCADLRTVLRDSEEGGELPAGVTSELWNLMRRLGEPVGEASAGDSGGGKAKGKAKGGKGRGVSARALLAAVRSCAPQFAGCAQQDAHELLVAMLSAIDDEERARERPRGSSGASALFTGSLVSTVTCSECGFRSYCEDETQCVSIELPHTPPKHAALGWRGKKQAKAKAGSFSALFDDDDDDDDADADDDEFCEALFAGDADDDDAPRKAASKGAKKQRLAKKRMKASKNDRKRAAAESTNIDFSWIPEESHGKKSAGAKAKRVSKKERKRLEREARRAGGGGAGTAAAASDEDDDDDSAGDGAGDDADDATTASVAAPEVDPDAAASDDVASLAGAVGELKLASPPPPPPVPAAAEADAARPPPAPRAPASAAQIAELVSSGALDLSPAELELRALMEAPATRVPAARAEDARAAAAAAADERAPLSLGACLAHFTRDEPLRARDGNGFRCPMCSRAAGAPTPRDATKRVVFGRRVPRVLVLHLKRLMPGYKLDRPVHFDPTLDLDPFVLGGVERATERDATRGGFKFRLFAVAVHLGGRSGGHYIAFSAGDSPRHESWDHISDSDVRTGDSPYGKQAYMLFYTRV